MRALKVLIALVAMPLVAGVAQGPDHQKWSTGLRTGWHGGSLPPGLAKKDPTVPQPPPPPPPPPPAPGPSCGVANPSAGTGAISGSVIEGRTGLFGGLSGWCIHLSVNGTEVASQASDGAGNFNFTGLADGMYLVCQDVQTGWTETTPSGAFYPVCPSGNSGYTVNVVAGGGGSVFFINQ
jgi:hypothetical protein